MEEKRDKTLLDMEKKIGNYNEKEQVLKNFRINKPNMNMNIINSKFRKENLMSFLNNFKKENEKIANEPNKMKYNIECDQDDDEEYEEDEIKEENGIKMNNINLDENEEDENDEKDKNKKEKKDKKGKKEKIELDLLMGILEQQKKNELTIDYVINNKKKERNNDNDDVQEGEKEIIDFLIEKK